MQAYLHEVSTRKVAELVKALRVLAALTQAGRRSIQRYGPNHPVGRG